MEQLKKSEIREKIKYLRKNLETEEEAAMNEAVFLQLTELDIIRRSSCVYCYRNTHHEAETGKLLQYLWEHHIKTALPRVEGRELYFYYIHSQEDLQIGSMGILEPSIRCEQAEDLLAPTIVPGLAFDEAGHRIGYGGGFYDRFFQREPQHAKIGIGFGFQMFSKLPYEEFDVSMDLLVTSKHI